MQKKKLLMIEFNELCPNLLNRWMQESKLPNFKKFYSNSEVFTTESDEKEPPYLEPWVQWYSIHTGLSSQQHKVFHLTDGPKAKHRDIWQTLLDNGKTVVNFSSMNARAFSSPGSVFLPDPWCGSEKAAPSELNIFQKVIANRVQEYSNKTEKMKLKDALNLLIFLLRHGLRANTMGAILKQITSEILFDRTLAWKRASLLDRLLLDVFRYYCQKFSPDFLTFFSNSTAHYQHSYWRYMEPEAFQIRPSALEISKKEHNILFGYQAMDRLLGDLFSMEEKNYILILVTALSQQPFLRKEATGGQNFYRPYNMGKLLEHLGIDFKEIIPVMTHQYLVRFSDHSTTHRALQALSSLECSGKTIFSLSTSEPNVLYIGNQISTVVPEGAKIKSSSGFQELLPYHDIFYRLPEMKGGRHHPDGVLWFKTGTHRVHQNKVSILDIFPTILKIYNIPIGTELRGKAVSLKIFGE